MVQIVDFSFSIEDEIDGDQLLRKIEKAGRTCYKSEDKITPDSSHKFVKMLLDRGHLAMLEHEKVTVRVVCDRGVSHEIVRHRIASYAQESTRYCNYSKAQFGNEITVAPMMDGLTPNQIARRMKLWEHSQQVYMDELNEGITPQQARDNLPTCLKTEIVVTYNLREWRYFFGLRTDPKAHPQMRKVMIPLLQEFRRRIPIIFDDVGCDA